MHFDKKVLFIALFVVLFLGCASAATLNAADCSFNAVSSKVSAANGGDTVIVPACPNGVTWDSALTIYKGVILKGAGIGQTVITAGASVYNMIEYSPSTATDFPFRVTGFTFYTSNSQGLVFNNMDNLVASQANIYKNIRIDHVRFVGNTLYDPKAMHNYGMRGVVDNCLFDNYDYPIRADKSERTDGKLWWDNWNFVFGDSSSNMYFEDNIFSGPMEIITDCQFGNRYAFRYNSINTTSTSYLQMFDLHGNASYYSCFGSELYGNKINSGTNGGQFYDDRGGKSLVFNNNYDQTASMSLQVREEYADSYAPTTNPQPQHVSDTYYWGNIRNGTVVDPAILTVCSTCVQNGLVENKDFFSYNPSCTALNCSSSGVGCGSATPTGPCAVGAGYWKTTQSCTNLAGMTGDHPVTPISGSLYKCDSTGHWPSTPYYTPLAYPHPYRTDCTSYPSLCDAGGSVIILPSVSITSPSSNASLVNTVNISATAVDGNYRVVGVQFKVDGVNIGLEDGSSPYSVSWNTTSVSDGVHVLTAVARDSNGNLVTSAGVNVNVINPVAPSISVGPASQSGYVNGSVTFSVSASGYPLNYQWQKNDANIAGANGATYTTPALASGDDQATFRVIVFNNLGSVTSSSATLSVSSVDSSLVGWWRMDESSGASSIADSPVNTYPGSLVGSPTFVSGKFGNSLSLDGSSQFANVGTQSVFDFTSAFTVSTWVKLSASASPDYAIVSKITGGSPFNGYMIWVSGGVPSTYINGGIRATGSKAIEDGLWHHVVSEWTGSSAVIYVDGVKASGLYAVAPASSANPLHIGDYPQADRFANGLVDDVCIFNRALSDSEVNSLYTSNSPCGGGTPANNPPSVSIISPTQGQVFSSAPASFDVNVNATDLDVGDAVASVKFYLDGGLVSTDANAPYSTRVINLASGTHTITATATDLEGAIGTQTINVIVNSPTGSNFHPADTGRNWDINGQEYAWYGACFKSPAICASGQGPVTNVDSSMYFNASNIWNIAPQTYTNLAGSTCPPNHPSTCWAPGSS